jgi:ectoine hydroxylase-related dioxygenase (phytanoyl-CoA dioxygenase family)
VTGVDEAAFFREHGWVRLPGAVDAQLAERLSAELDRVFPEARLPSPRVHERLGVSALSPLLAAQVRSQDVARRVATLLDCERVQLLQDTALVKPPRSEARVEWHQDQTYTGYLDIAACVSVRLALTPCSRESGCLRVIDRSHHEGFRGGLRAFRADEVGDDSQLMPPGWEERVIEVELAPGDVSVHHCLTFHSSEPNRSAHPRRTLIARLFDARAKLLPDRLPPGLEAYFPTQPDGRLSPAVFPLL